MRGLEIEELLICTINQSTSVTAHHHIRHYIRVTPFTVEIAIIHRRRHLQQPLNRRFLLHIRLQLSMLTFATRNMISGYKNRDEATGPNNRKLAKHTTSTAIPSITSAHRTKEQKNRHLFPEHDNARKVRKAKGNAFYRRREAKDNAAKKQNAAARDATAEDTVMSELVKTHAMTTVFAILVSYHDQKIARHYLPKVISEA